MCTEYVWSKAGPMMMDGGEWEDLFGSSGATEKPCLCFTLLSVDLRRFLAS